MTVYDVIDKLSGWNYFRITDGENVYYDSNGGGYKKVTDAVCEAKVIGLEIERNTLVIEIDEIEEEC